MPNTETIHLNMTPGDADRVAVVLMTALRMVTMTPVDRETTTGAANALFLQLKYGYGTDTRGERVELKGNRIGR